MTTVPLPGCCNCCHEPVTPRQKSVVFEGANLRYPELGENSAVFHTRSSCRWDARGYDEVWATATPGRVQKFEGSPREEAMAKLIRLAQNAGPGRDEGVPVTLHLTGGAYDGACMSVSLPSEYRELYYTEPVKQPHARKPGVLYEHSADCPCGAAGTGRMAEGDHVYRPQLQPALKA